MSYEKSEEFATIKKQILDERRQLEEDLNLLNQRFENPDQTGREIEFSNYIEEIEKKIHDYRYEESARHSLLLIKQLCNYIGFEIKGRILSPLLKSMGFIKILEAKLRDYETELKELKGRVKEQEENKDKLALFDSFEINPKSFIERYENYKEKLNEKLNQNLNLQKITPTTISNELNKILLTDSNKFPDFKDNLLLKIAMEDVRKKWKEKHCL